MNLKQKAITGVKWTTLSSAVNALLQLTQLMILARFLTPHDFGLVAILMVVIGFSQIFVDFGLSKAIIYNQHITASQLSTLYWLNIILSLVIFGIIFLSSSFIATFYNEPSLSNLIILVSSSLIIQAFGQQFRTLFQKELQFNVLAKIDIFAASISFMSAISLAINGFGVYALIYPVLIMAALKSILLVYKGIVHHKPKIAFNIFEIKDFLAFGSYTVGNGIVSTVATQIDVILIGKLLGTETLGLYSIIKELILRPSQLINPIITKVSFPAMAKVNNDVEKVKNIYLKLINYVSSINFPIYIASFILAPEIISLFLGDKWLNGVEIFQILSIWALIRSRGNPIGSLVMAMGKPQYEMYWNIGMMFFMSITVYVSSAWDITGISYGNLISLIILFIPGWYFLTFRLCKASLKEYFTASLYPLLISLFTGIVVYIILHIYSAGMTYKFIVSVVVGLPILWILNKKYNQDFYSMIISLIRRDR